MFRPLSQATDSGGTDAQTPSDRPCGQPWTCSTAPCGSPNRLAARASGWHLPAAVAVAETNRRARIPFTEIVEVMELTPQMV